MPPNIVYRPVTVAGLPRVSQLHAKVFGPGRFTRAAYRVREGTAPISRFCRVACLKERMIASVRFTHVTIGGAEGALLLGPLAVDPEFAGKGYAQQLVREALEDVKAAGLPLVVLVGDESYYGRFGFTPVPPGQITLPGPVAPTRLLAVELIPGKLATFQGLIVGKRV